MPSLRLDWVGADAARFACKRWHYTRTTSVASVKIGVWEDGHFIGVILFGLGAGNATSGIRFGLRHHHDIAELVRIALAPWHKTPVSRCVAIAIKMLRKQSPGLRMVISFADTGQGHHGGIYQAGGWTYLGMSTGEVAYIVNGKRKHSKTIADMGLGDRMKGLREHLDPNAKRVRLPGKHRYVLPLDDEIRARILPLAQAYPKRAKDQDAGYPSALGGETPTRTLQL